MSFIVLKRCTVKKNHPWSIYFTFEALMDGDYRTQSPVYELKFERTDIQCDYLDYLKIKGLSKENLLKFLRERFNTEDLFTWDRGKYDSKKVHAKFNQLKAADDLTYQF